jgi:MFS transporter, Spinster family, sphingosine-1-phosphate transporter
MKIRSARAILATLSAVNVLNYADRYVGAAMLPLILVGLGLTDAEGGLMQSAFILSYSIVSPLAGWLGDRWARLRLAAVGVFTWSAATVASGLAPSYAALLVARAVIGVGEGSYSVLTPSVLSDLYSPERRSRAFAIFYAAIPVGTAVGYAVGGTVGAAFGWRAGFFAAGIPGAFLALLLLWAVEPKRGASDEAGVQPETPLRLGPSLRALWARSSYRFNTAAQILFTFSMGGLATWMPTYYVRERGLSLGEASTTFGVLLLVAGFAGTVAGGLLCDRLTHRVRSVEFTISGLGLVLSLLFTAGAVLAPSPAVFWPCTFATLLLLFLNIGPLNAALANVLPPDLRARGFAITTMAMHLFGDAASPWLIGVASDRVGLTAPILGSGVLLATAGVLLLIGRRTLERDLASSHPADDVS